MIHYKRQAFRCVTTRIVCSSNDSGEKKNSNYRFEANANSHSSDFRLFETFWNDPDQNVTVFGKKKFK